MKSTLVPAVLAYSFEEFKKQLEYFDDYAPRVHIDIMDGEFVDNTTYADAKKISKIKSKAKYDLHLMVSNPMDVLNEWITDKRVASFIIHIEVFGKNKKDLYDIIKHIKRHKKKISLAINPSTPISKILEFIHLIDQVMLMGVQPGWSGQKLTVSVLAKIKALRSYYPKLSLSFDGGVTKDVIPVLQDFGINDIVAHSLVYKKNMKTALIKEVLQTYFTK